MVGGEETIAAIATPLGEGAVGLVRLSGSKSWHIASTLSRSKDGCYPLLTNESIPRMAYHVYLYRGESLLDDAIAILYKSPQSFTGEDAAEFFCHGSTAILQRVLKVVLDLGARIANPGEFTERAFLNGKIDLAQAEAVGDLIRYGSKKSSDNALMTLTGLFSRKIRDHREQLTTIIASLEAGLDFPEEDIPPYDPTVIRANLSMIINELKVLLSTSISGRLIKDGAKIVLVGAPNVGKSSLFNALLASDRAIVTSDPGTTRDILEETVEWNGIYMHLVDTAGIRQNPDRVEAIGIQKTQSASQQAAVQLFLHEAGKPLSDEEELILKTLDLKKTILVLTKTDLLSNSAPIPLTENRNFDDEALRKKIIAPYISRFKDIVLTSAQCPFGLNALKEAVLRRLDVGPGDHPETFFLANERHQMHIEKALKYMTNASFSLMANRVDEVTVTDLKEALKEFGTILGDDVSDDVLNKIFSTFCIGK